MEIKREEKEEAMKFLENMLKEVLDSITKAFTEAYEMVDKDGKTKSPYMLGYKDGIQECISNINMLKSKLPVQMRLVLEQMETDQ